MVTQSKPCDFISVCWYIYMLLYLFDYGENCIWSLAKELCQTLKPYRSCKGVQGPHIKINVKTDGLVILENSERNGLVVLRIRFFQNRWSHCWTLEELSN